MRSIIFLYWKNSAVRATVRNFPLAPEWACNPSCGLRPSKLALLRWLPLTLLESKIFYSYRLLFRGLNRTYFLKINSLGRREGMAWAVVFSQEKRSPTLGVFIERFESIYLRLSPFAELIRKFVRTRSLFWLPDSCRAIAFVCRSV